MSDSDGEEKKVKRAPAAQSNGVATKGGEGKIAKLQNQVKEVVDEMKINIEKVIDRGQNLDDLNDRSEQLGAAGDLFSKRARNLKKSMWLRTCRSRLYLALIITFVLAFFICKSIQCEIYSF